MNHAEVKRRQFQALSLAVSCVAVMVMARVLGYNGVTYVAVAMEAYLLVWTVFPFSLELCRSMRRYVKYPQEEVRWKLWYGPVKNWDRLRELGVDWFLVRWLLARNIVIYFSGASMAAIWLSGGAG